MPKLSRVAPVFIHTIFTWYSYVITSFPDSSLFFPRERTLVAAGRVTASLFQAPRETREGEGEGTKTRGAGGEKKRERRGACEHFFKHLMPVYHLPVYPLIGQF